MKRCTYSGYASMADAPGEFYDTEPPLKQHKGEDAPDGMHFAFARIGVELNAILVRDRPTTVARLNQDQP